jgi:hypothetical protein
MKLLLTSLLATFLLAVMPLNAEVIVSIADLDNKVMRVTYNVTDNDAGKNSTVFPSNGYTFIKLNPEDEDDKKDDENIEEKYDFKVISVTEKNSEQALAYEVIEIADKPAIKVSYPNPVPAGGNYNLEVTVEAPTDNIAIDPEGRYEITYQTGLSSALFLLPKGHAVVYTNYPVLVHEKQGQTVVKVKQPGLKTIIIKTRLLNEEQAATAEKEEAKAEEATK